MGWVSFVGGCCSAARCLGARACILSCFVLVGLTWWRSRMGASGRRCPVLCLWGIGVRTRSIQEGVLGELIGRRPRGRCKTFNDTCPLDAGSRAVLQTASIACLFSLPPLQSLQWRAPRRSAPRAFRCKQCTLALTSIVPRLQSNRSSPPPQRSSTGSVAVRGGA